MTSPTQSALSRKEVVAQLTGEGGPFEITVEEIDGKPMRMYRNRMRSLREIPQGALRRDEAEHLVSGSQRWTFRRFVEETNAVSHALLAAGVGPGDRVAILSANNPQWCLSFWGVVDIGAICVGLNGWWTTDEIRFGLHDSGARVLIADQKRFERIAGHLDECPDLERVYLTDAEPDGTDGRVRRFDELVAEPSQAFPAVDIDEAAPAVIFYTSGTTGRPKGAISTHRSMIANLTNTFFNAIASAMVSGTEPGGSGQTAALLTSPLFHVSGCHNGIVTGLAAGMKLVMMEGRFDPAEALRLIQDEQIKLWATVPTMVWRVCEHPSRTDYDTSSVTTVAFGGSPSGDELQRMIAETFPNVSSMSNAYGLTESSSVASVNSGIDMVERPNSVGLPMPVVDIRTVDEQGHDTPPGVPGEVLIRGPIVMPGYWNRPDATAETVVDGWLHTGDVGHLDEDGYLYITDRAKDMIIRGGENIYCVEIENRLVAHPAVADAAVIGVPHAELGEEVKAVIQVAPGASLTDDAVRAWVAEELAGFKVPAHVEFRTEKLPRNASGKLLKNALRGTGEVSFSETM